MPTLTIPQGSGGFLAVHEGRVVFAPKPKRSANPDALLKAEKAKELGEDGVILPLDTITSVVVHNDREGMVVMNGKGLNVVVAKIPDPELRGEVVAKVTESRRFTKHEKRSGVFATAMTPLMITIVALILTLGGVAASLDAGGGTVDGGNRSGRRGAQQRGFAAIVSVLGPVGTAVIGGLVVAAAAARVHWKLKHHRYQIDRFKPE
jgi:hypothetical protein